MLFKRWAVPSRRQTEAASVRQGELWSLGGGGNTQSGRRCLLTASSWISSVFVTTTVQSESVNQCELCSSAGDLLPPGKIMYSIYSWSTLTSTDSCFINFLTIGLCRVKKSLTVMSLFHQNQKIHTGFFKRVSTTGCWSSSLHTVWFIMFSWVLHSHSM